MSPDLDPYAPIVWLDVETTGLDPSFDQLLEVAVVVTNSGLRPLGTYTRVVHQLEHITMRPEVFAMHTKTGLREASLDGGSPLWDIELELNSMFRELGVTKESPLAGSSVHFDRNFLKAYMPEIERQVSHRNLDVSTLKEMVKRWAPGKEWKKADVHRALPDIHDSINELKHYRLTFGLGW